MHQWIFLKLGHNGPWAVYGVQELWVHGPTRKGPRALFLKSYNMLLSYNLCSTVLMVCHNDTWVVVPSGCSGILGPWSNKDPRAQFGEILQNGSFPTISVIQC